MKNKIIDLFCGCGGLSLGFEMAGFEPILAIDLWKDAIITYNHNRKKRVGMCSDIKELSNEFLKSLNEDGEIVGVIGGPPCQGYSTVGTRDINDPRNHLYLQYCRVVEQVKPTFFVLENVKGLTTLCNGMFRDDIYNRFTKLGYNVSYKIINAAHYGVPQKRERVFFVGIKNAEFEFPAGDDNKLITCKDALSDLPKLNEMNGAEQQHKYVSEPQTPYQALMRKNSTIIRNHQLTMHTEQTKQIISMIPDGGRIKDLPREYWDIRKYNKAFERMSSVRPSNTVDTGHRNYFHYSENRIPTARENARLQSFPDDFEIIGTRTSQYKQIGNAVPPLMAYAIAKAIKEQI
jgi:DNA (cytosine-5)-methyltransferase 1